MFDFDGLRRDAVDEIIALMESDVSIVPSTDLTETVYLHCRHFRVLAAASLLLDGKPTMFFKNLVRAAENWLAVLNYVRRRGDPPPPTSWNAPMLGAMAAGVWDLASEIAQVAAAERRPKLEYVNDYRYADVLRLLVLHPDGNSDEIGIAIDQLEDADTGDLAGRLDVLRGLILGDAATFRDGFRSALADHEGQVETDIYVPSIPVMDLAPSRYVWVEGLAILRLGNRRGITMNEDLPLCPRMARLDLAVGRDRDWILSFPGQI